MTREKIAFDTVANIPRDKIKPENHAYGIWPKLAALHKAGNPLGLLLQMARHHDGCIPLQMRSQKVFLLTEAQHFKRVLQTNGANYTKYLDGMTPIFGGSMITMDGALWQKMRVLQQPAFHPDMMSDYVPLFLAAIGKAKNRMTQLARSGEPVDICEETWALAADMTCKALFDRETPFNPYFVFKAVKAFTNVTNHDSGRRQGVDDGARNGNDGEIANATGTWAALPETILGAAPQQGRERTLLRFIEAAAADEAVPEFDRHQVLDEIKQYIWAGTETTALMLAWALYLTSAHQDVADRVRREGREVFGEREPGLADYLKLTYTRNVIQETMRMYPPIWSLARKAEAADVIGGHDIKPGDTIVLGTYMVHHNPNYWDHPDRFDPDRFGAERTKGRAPYSYLPFGGGKRACIGSAMSQVEAALALSLFLRDFEFEYARDEPPRISLTVTLSPKQGLPLRIRRRAQTRTSCAPMARAPAARRNARAADREPLVCSVGA
jgi:cytochrome P450